MSAEDPAELLESRLDVVPDVPGPPRACVEHVGVDLVEALRELGGDPVSGPGLVHQATHQEPLEGGAAAEVLRGGQRHRGGEAGRRGLQAARGDPGSDLLLDRGEGLVERPGGHGHPRRERLILVETGPGGRFAEPVQVGHRGTGPASGVQDVENPIDPLRTERLAGEPPILEGGADPIEDIVVEHRLELVESGLRRPSGQLRNHLRRLIEILIPLASEHRGGEVEVGPLSDLVGRAAPARSGRNGRRVSRPRRRVRRDPLPDDPEHVVQGGIRARGDRDLVSPRGPRRRGGPVDTPARLRGDLDQVRPDDVEAGGLSLADRLDPYDDLVARGEVQKVDVLRLAVLKLAVDGGAGSQVLSPGVAGGGAERDGGE